MRTAWKPFALLTIMVGSVLCLVTAYMGLTVEPVGMGLLTGASAWGYKHLPTSV